MKLVQEGGRMRLIPQLRWKKWFCWATMLVLVASAGWLYLAATQSPINLRNVRKLDPRATRDEAECLFGPSTSPVRIVFPKPYENLWKNMGGADYPDFWWVGLDIPGFPSGDWNGGPVIPATKIGDLTPGWSESLAMSSHRPLWVEISTWDGPELQIKASFDDRGKMYGCRVQQRLSWRGKVREWLPWMP